IRFGYVADLLRAQRDQFLAQRFTGFDAAHQRDVGINTLALDVVRVTDHGGFGDGVVQDQRTFDFGGAHAVARNVEYVVDAAGNPVVTVGIAAGAIAGGVVAREG